MTEAIGRAQFGDVGGSHGLISVEGIEADLVNRIRWLTDLPHNSTNTGWDSYFAGYRVDDVYVVQYTRPDPSASRSGMVTTSAVVGPIERMVNRPLAEHTAAAASEEVGQLPLPDGLAGVLDVLADDGYVYWTPLALHRSVVEHVWAVLSEGDRAQLVFGLAFSSQTAHSPDTNGSLRVFAIPAEVRGRFDPHLTIDGDRPPLPRLTATAMLGEGLQLQRDLNVTAPSLQQWGRLATAQSLFDKVDSLDPEQLRSLTHLVGYLAPDPGSGAAVKETVALQLHRTAAGSDFDHVQGWRTFELDSIPQLNLEAMINDWVPNLVANGQRFADLERAIAAISNGSATDCWATVLSSSLQNHLRADHPGSVGHLAAASHKGKPSTFEWIARTVGVTADSAFADQYDGTAEWIGDLAFDLKWPHTHAVACTLDEPVTAWRRQLALQTSDSASVGRLRARCDDSTIVSVASEVESDELTELAGAIVVNNPSALEPPRPASSGWRAVWAAAVEAGADAWTSLSAEEGTDALLTAALAGDNVPAVLLSASASSESGNLADHPRRARVWAVAPEPARSEYLRRTAQSLSLRGDLGAMEAPLASIVTGRTNITSVAKVDAGKAIKIVEEFPGMCGEKGLRAIVEAARLSPGDATRIGQVVSANRWGNVATYLARNAQQRSDLRPAAEASSHLLSVVDKFTIGWFGGGRPSSSEVSEGLLAVASQLYPMGPQHQDVWERAGGDPADLPSGASGRDIWRRALEAATAGASGAPSLPSLVAEMQSDFASNKALAKIADVL